jgi:hypothetical protein
MAWYDNVSEADLYKQALEGPSEEDLKSARGMGMLSAGLGILSAPRDRNYWPGVFQGLAGGVGAYQGSLKESRAQHKANIEEAIKVKKFNAESEASARLAPLFSSGGEPDYMAIARSAAESGNPQLVMQALQAHERKLIEKKPIAIPKGTKQMYDYQTRQFIPVPEVPGEVDEEKLTPAARHQRELEAQGVDPKTARSLAYGAFKPQTLADGTTVMIDMLTGQPLTPRVRGPATSVAPTQPPGAPVGAEIPARPIDGAGLPPPVAPPVAPPGMPTQQSAAPAPAPSRFANVPLPTAAVPGTVTRGVKPAKELDAAVEHLAGVYGKSGVEDMDSKMSRMLAALEPYIEKDDKGKYKLKPGANVPGLGMTGGWFPQQLLSSEGKDVSGALQGILNQQLYDLSGKAVTKNEMDRFVKQMQTGPFMKDEDAIRALNSVIEQYQGHKTNILSAANPEVLKEYFRRKQEVVGKQEGAFTGIVDKMGYEHTEDGEATGRRFEKRNGVWARTK